MNPWTLAFVGIGVVLALIGACKIAFDWKKEDQDSRLPGWIIFVAGLAIAAMTVFAARMAQRY
jgi:hypothetical protein